MSARPPRKFTILDGMILVAAIACGFALRRAVLDSFHGFWVMQDESWLIGIWVMLDESWLIRNVRGLSCAATPFLTMLTPTVLLLRLCRPRPRRIELFRQPGMVACCASILPLVVCLARFALACLKRSTSGDDPFELVNAAIDFQSEGYSVGLWVLGAWLALALSGRRRAERSWIDRLGRTIGVGWLMVLVIHILDPIY